MSLPQKTHQPAPEQQTLPLETLDDDYEVITSEEVDRVLDALDQLIASVQSENVRSCLEEAADSIYALIYGEEGEAGEEEAA
jgi:hypothetical protein